MEFPPFGPVSLSSNPGYLRILPAHSRPLTDAVHPSTYFGENISRYYDIFGLEVPLHSPLRPVQPLTGGALQSHPRIEDGFVRRWLLYIPFVPARRSGCFSATLNLRSDQDPCQLWTASKKPLRPVRPFCEIESTMWDDEISIFEVGLTMSGSLREKGHQKVRCKVCCIFRWGGACSIQVLQPLLPAEWAPSLSCFGLPLYIWFCVHDRLEGA